MNWFSFIVFISLQKDWSFSRYIRNLNSVLLNHALQFVRPGATKL
uniref:Uncharacterized protein n=1 Tax=Anguilla anguilla TaxID=7936 RepID=A0A0E9Q0Q9_ANGAN